MRQISSYYKTSLLPISSKASDGGYKETTRIEDNVLRWEDNRKNSNQLPGIRNWKMVAEDYKKSLGGQSSKWVIVMIMKYIPKLGRVSTAL